MPSVFESHSITVEGNGIQYKPGTRQPVGGYTKIATGVICHIGRSSKRNDGNILRVFILKKYVDLLPTPLARGYKIIDEESTFVYSIIETPVWAGGMKHHIECTLEEFR